jgi:hypothetical protein
VKDEFSVSQIKPYVMTTDEFLKKGGSISTDTTSLENESLSPSSSTSTFPPSPTTTTWTEFRLPPVSQPSPPTSPEFKLPPFSPVPSRKNLHGLFSPKFYFTLNTGEPPSKKSNNMTPVEANLLRVLNGDSDCSAGLEYLKHLLEWNASYLSKESRSRSEESVSSLPNIEAPF